MTVAAHGSGAAAKRKRDGASTDKSKARKRARSESVGSEDDDSHEASREDRILQLEKEILESKKNYNNIVALLGIARSEVASAGRARSDNSDDSDGSDAEGPELTACVASCRVFLRLLAAGSLSLAKPGLSEKEEVVVKWLVERMAELKMILVDLFLQSGDAASTALTLAMRLLRAEGQHLQASHGGETDKSKAASGKSGKKQPKDTAKPPYAFPQSFLRYVVQQLLLTRDRLGAEVSEALTDEFVQKYVGAYHDVRFYTFEALSTLLCKNQPARGQTEAGRTAAAFHLLLQVDNVPGDKESFRDASAFYVPPPAMRSHALYSVAEHKKQAQHVWLTLLSQAVMTSSEDEDDETTSKNKGKSKNKSSKNSSSLRKQVLTAMEGVIAPWFAQPELLLDYLTDCYDAGGSTSLLALSGLYYLIRVRNVDYPAFYTKLYSLLDGDLLHSRHRARFFRLLDTFLDSTHLPAQLVASFIKRLARLALLSPPSAIVTVVPWIYNMFMKHPLCTFMIHRVPRSAEERADLASHGLADPFRADEADPMETHAIDSCLWEIVQLQSHYHPNVATIAKIISEQFTKQSYNMEDFLDHSYQSMFEAEIGKQVKKTPVVEFHIPKRVFLPQDPSSGIKDSFLVQHWDFS